ncbi:protein takeout-like [Ctenocephalides felis]|uniref:protein takeout-like n=1 Tax=Ctenocephalides felis TaxID=7515 RepID=UPI000E6E4172|nr:protein takeout-like [Ctenocephalides felis]
MKLYVALCLAFLQVFGTTGEMVIENRMPLLKSKPDWLGVCQMSNPNKDDCFKNLFEGMFPALSRGIPEIGVASFEPLHIDGVMVSRGSGGLALSGGFRDLQVGGPSNATVQRASIDFVTRQMNFDLAIPKLKIDAKYSLKGNILLLPVVGNGDARLTLRDVMTSVSTNFSLVESEPGRQVLNIDTMKVTFIVGGMRIHLTNLFNGNEILGASLNLFLNQNAMEVISELRSDLESGLADIFKALWNNVFSRLPLDLWTIP